MPRTGKHVAHYRHGQGKHHVEKWSTFEPGPLADQHDVARADMFVDVNPYVSLAGINTARQYSRRAATHLDEHAIARTRGQTLRKPPTERRKEMPFGTDEKSKQSHHDEYIARKRAEKGAP